MFLPLEVKTSKDFKVENILYFVKLMIKVRTINGKVWPRFETRVFYSLFWQNLICLTATRLGNLYHFAPRQDVIGGVYEYQILQQGEVSTGSGFSVACSDRSCFQGNSIHG